MSPSPVRNPTRVAESISNAVAFFEGHLRVGQIISNALQRKGKPCDPFYIEDDDLAQAIDDFVDSQKAYRDGR